jgi:hypothetical protein
MCMKDIVLGVLIPFISERSLVALNSVMNLLIAYRWTFSSLIERTIGLWRRTLLLIVSHLLVSRSVREICTTYRSYEELQLFNVKLPSSRTSLYFSWRISWYVEWCTRKHYSCLYTEYYLQCYYFWQLYIYITCNALTSWWIRYV